MLNMGNTYWLNVFAYYDTRASVYRIFFLKTNENTMDSWTAHRSILGTENKYPFCGIADALLIPYI